MLIINAPNICKGGGYVLLKELVTSLQIIEENVVLILDARIYHEFKEDSCFKVSVKPTIIGRLIGNYNLYKVTSKADKVVCFGNIPPLFKLKGNVSVFVQNRYLIENISLVGFSIKTKLRIIYERLRLKLFALNADEFIVQTPSMKRALLLSGFTSKQPIYIRPFASVPHEYYRRITFNKFSDNIKKFDFIYAASGEPHKNHRRLVEAWCLLAEQAIYPSLCLTINPSTSVELCAWIDEKKRGHSLNLSNVGNLPHSHVLELYAQTRALIFPSRFESFGLPLIEACQANLPVLAAELDYVRDVLDPVETFDPSSPVSIARAVKRFLGKEEAPLPLTDAEKFLHLLLM